MTGEIATTQHAPDYGLDAPGVIRNLALFGGLLVLVGLGVRLAAPQLVGPLGWCLWSGLGMSAAAVLMVWSSRVGKLLQRDRMLDALQLQGDERVLDVGCGHGLLLVGAAKRVPRGSAVGIDLWSQEDQATNSAAATLRNAALEGVAERVTVESGDMRKLPYADASFDLVVASLSIHNIPTAEGRAEAVREIARVVKPGGRVALLDFQMTAEYAATLRACGWKDVARSLPQPFVFPPSRIVRGTKA